ncbi:unnamed protein product, partial [Ixodes persulcatus]
WQYFRTPAKLNSGVTEPADRLQPSASASRERVASARVVVSSPQCRRQRPSGEGPPGTQRGERSPIWSGRAQPSSDVDGEELLVQGGELEVGHGAAELGQRVHVQQADLAQAGQLGHQAVEDANVAFVRLLVRLVQLVAQALEDGRAEPRDLRDPLQARPVPTWGEEDVGGVERQLRFRQLHLSYTPHKVEGIIYKLDLQGFCRVHGKEAVVVKHEPRGNVEVPTHPEDAQLEAPCRAEARNTSRSCTYPQQPAHTKRPPLKFRTCFEQHYLVILRELHESRHHLGELNDLLDDLGQLLRAIQPQFLGHHVFVEHDARDVQRLPRQILDVFGGVQAGPAVSVRHGKGGLTEVRGERGGRYNGGGGGGSGGEQAVGVRRGVHLLALLEGGAVHVVRAHLELDRRRRRRVRVPVGCVRGQLLRVHSPPVEEGHGLVGRRGRLLLVEDRAVRRRLGGLGPLCGRRQALGGAGLARAGVGPLRPHQLRPVEPHLVLNLLTLLLGHAPELHRCTR